MTADELHARFMGEVAQRLSDAFPNEQVEVKPGRSVMVGGSDFGVEIHVAIATWETIRTYGDDFLTSCDFAVDYVVESLTRDFRAMIPS